MNQLLINELPSSIISSRSATVCPLIPKQRSKFQSHRKKVTAALNGAMRTMGERLDMHVCHKAKGLKRLDPTREFMWDHAWFDGDSRLGAVMESEFSARTG